MPSTFTLACSSGIGFKGVPAGYATPIRLSIASSVGLQGVPTLTALRSLRLNVAASIGLQGVPTVVDHRFLPLSVTAGIGLSAAPVLTKTSEITLEVVSGLAFTDAPTLAKVSEYNVSVATGFGVGAQLGMTAAGVHQLSVSAGLGLQGILAPNITKLLAVSAGFGVAGSPSSLATRVLSVSAGIGIVGVPRQTREIVLSVTAGVGLAGNTAPRTLLHTVTAAAGLGLHGGVTVSLSNAEVSAGIGLQALVSCQVIVAPGIGGPSTALLRGLSGDFPLTFAETSAGVVLAANGVDPMIRWDGMSNTADFAGVQPPATAPTLAASGLGTITGLRYAFCRFIDSRGNPSNLSPISSGVQCGRDQSLDDIALSATGLVTCTSRAHGLTTGSTIILQGIQGLPLNGTVSITVLDQDRFTLSGVVASGVWLGGGSFVQGSASVTYSGLPTTLQPSVSSLQVLRNLEGNLDVLYLAASIPIQTTTYTDSLADESLAQNEALVIRTPDNWPLASRFSPPPSNRPYVVNYMGRIFAAGDVIVFAGCVAVTSGSNIIQGIGTQWTASLVGRQIYVKGSSRSYGISSINTSTQSATISASYLEPSQPFATYLIRSSPQERKVLQWSEPDNPEAWPPWNALAIPEDNDDITGLFVKGTYLYICERRHVWKFQFTDDPGRTGHVFLALDQRGAITQRCIALADDLAFIMDETGVYSFDGSGAKPISDPVQVVFYADGLSPTPQIDWSQDQTLWHASLDPTRTIVRWFVSMTGATALQSALAYNYRLDRWWLESYPVAISSSCTGTLAEAPNAGITGGSRRALAGAECRQVLVLGEAALDLAPAEGTLRGSVTSSTTVSLTDTAAAFGTALQGAPITLVSGTGAGQSSLISTVVGQTITVVDAWTVLPDTTTVYQIGGVPWQWRSGWLDIEAVELQTARDLLVSYQPLEQTSVLSVQLFHDHATTPEAWAFPYYQDGVSVATGEPNIEFDMTADNVLPGWRTFRQTQHSERYSYSERYIQVLLHGVTNAEVVRVYQVSLRGVDQEGI